VTPDPVSYRELRDVLDALDAKLDQRFDAIDAKRDAADERFAAHELDDEKRFGQQRTILVTGGIAQTIVVSLVAAFGPDGAASTVKTVAEHALRAFA
jgi:hypothetical protein